MQCLGNPSLAPGGRVYLYGRVCPREASLSGASPKKSSERTTSGYTPHTHTFRSRRCVVLAGRYRRALCL